MEQPQPKLPLLDKKYRNSLYDALCGNGLTHDVADFLSKLAMDVMHLMDKVEKLEKK